MPRHGDILCGLIATPDLHAALRDYAGALGLRVVEDGHVDDALAQSWGAPAASGARQALLSPVDGRFLRLVETPPVPGFAPTTSFGWAAFELTVQDVMNWPARLASSGFVIVGPPAELPEVPYFVAMQITGRGGEMLYLNEVRSDTPRSDLPRAAAQIDRIFIAVLAAPDRRTAIDWYCDRLRLQESSSYTLRYDLINAAFGLPDTHQTTITMVQQGRTPALEIDDYPPAATPRPPCAPGHLPPGNAMLTLAVDSLDALSLPLLAPPRRAESPLYAGRRMATTRGAAGELIELVEIG